MGLGSRQLDDCEAERLDRSLANAMEEAPRSSQQMAAVRPPEATPELELPTPGEAEGEGRWVLVPRAAAATAGGWSGV